MLKCVKLCQSVPKRAKLWIIRTFYAVWHSLAQFDTFRHSYAQIIYNSRLIRLFWITRHSFAQFCTVLRNLIQFGTFLHSFAQDKFLTVKKNNQSFMDNCPKCAKLCQTVPNGSVKIIFYN